MPLVPHTIGRLSAGSDGQNLVEYGLLAALIAIAAIAGVTTLGRFVNTVMWRTIASAL